MCSTCFEQVRIQYSQVPGTGEKEVIQWDHPAIVAAVHLQRGDFVEKDRNDNEATDERGQSGDGAGNGAPG